MKTFKNFLIILITCLIFNLLLMYIFQDAFVKDLSVPKGYLGEICKEISRVFFGETDFNNLREFDKIVCSLFTYISLEVVIMCLSSLVICLFNSFVIFPKYITKKFFNQEEEYITDEYDI